LQVAHPHFNLEIDRIVNSSALKRAVDHNSSRLKSGRYTGPMFDAPPDSATSDRPAHNGGEPRWLTKNEQEAWAALAGMMTKLPAALDTQLQRDAKLTLFEYFVLSALSMAERRTLTMSQLAAIVNGSLSRLSNVIKQLERRGWVRREQCQE